jgi:hypothetical protein
MYIRRDSNLPLFISRSKQNATFSEKSEGKVPKPPIEKRLKNLIANE